jgi:hypothetical protein
MTRLRCTREEAKAEAIRLATEFIAKRDDGEQYRYFGARPDGSLPKTDSGKIPAVWLVVFAWQLPDAVVDGGELFVRVNDQTKVTEIYPTSLG